MDETTRLIAEFAAGLDDDAPALPARAAAKRHLIDAIACALGALDCAPARIARAVAARVGGSGGVSVLGLPTKTAPEHAAFANAVMIRHLDFNDTGHGGHPSDVIGAVLAMAESRRSNGRQVIRAMHAATRPMPRFAAAAFMATCCDDAMSTNCKPLSVPPSAPASFSGSTSSGWGMRCRWR